MGRKTERAVVARNHSPYNHLSQWHCICIEEPFTLSNTAHSVYDERIFDSIKRAFVEGFHELDTNRELNSFLGVKKSSVITTNNTITNKESNGVATTVATTPSTATTTTTTTILNLKKQRV